MADYKISKFVLIIGPQVNQAQSCVCPNTAESTTSI